VGGISGKRQPRVGVAKQSTLALLSRRGLTNAADSRTTAPGIWVVDAVATAPGFPLAVAAFGTRRQVISRADVDRLAAVRTAVRACRDIASSWNRVCHDAPFVAFRQTYRVTQRLNRPRASLESPPSIRKFSRNKGQDLEKSNICGQTCA
jgi:hypothetical protein